METAGTLKTKESACTDFTLLHSVSPPIVIPSGLVTPAINTAKQERRLERTPICSTPAPTARTAPHRGQRARSEERPASVHLPSIPAGVTAKSNMKILVAVAVFFLLSTQLFAEEIGTNDDLNYWSDWSDSDQIKEALPDPFEHLLQRIARRPKPQQFFGLMGKRDAGHGQISHKKGEISSNFSKAQCQWNCPSLPVTQSPKKEAFSLLPEAEKLLCSLAPPVVAFMLTM
ncbi:hypothetical protein ACRRTK_015642 [Alexandromys fortis]